MKRKIFISLAILVVLIFLQSSLSKPSPLDSYHHAEVKIGNETFDALVADTDNLKEQGLSGFRSLSEHQAMLFPYNEPATLPFWMKGMLFSIDILWLDSDYKAIYMKKYASPDSYPKSFSPAAPAQYVLEFSSGTLDRIGILVGDVLSISLEK